VSHSLLPVILFNSVSDSPFPALLPFSAMCVACGVGAVIMRQLVARYPYVIPEKEVSDDTEQYGDQKLEKQ
jgi:hypothetical protein